MAAPDTKAAEFRRQPSPVARNTALRIWGPAIMTNAIGKILKKAIGILSAGGTAEKRDGAHHVISAPTRWMSGQRRAARPKTTASDQRDRPGSFRARLSDHLRRRNQPRHGQRDAPTAARQRVFQAAFSRAGSHTLKIVAGEGFEADALTTTQY